MIIFGQCDPRWAKHPLGWAGQVGTICQYGCLDTCFAMIARDAFADLAWVTPATIDEAFTRDHIFARDNTGTYDLLPDSAEDLEFSKRFSHQSIAGYPAASVAAAVKSPDTYAILWISTTKVPTHFVIAWTADGQYIADPATGGVNKLANYGGPGAVHKAILVKKLAPTPAPQPAPTPAPPAPVPAPTPQPVPAPVPAPQPEPIPAPVTGGIPPDFWARLQILILQLLGRLPRG